MSTEKRIEFVLGFFQEIAKEEDAGRKKQAIEFYSAALAQCFNQEGNHHLGPVFKHLLGEPTAKELLTTQIPDHADKPNNAFYRAYPEWYTYRTLRPDLYSGFTKEEAEEVLRWFPRAAKDWRLSDETS